MTMPVAKEERDESDGEEMEHESGETDKSSSTCESSDAASDSDDSSEMDEEECERRRTECVENLVDLESQFTLLREQLYCERLTQVDGKLCDVRSGRAAEYVQPLEQLQRSFQARTEVAGVLRELRLANIKNKVEAEALAALQNHESEKCLLWDSIEDDLRDKIRRLEEDRTNADGGGEFWCPPPRRRRGDRAGRRRQVAVSGPYIVYQLRDADILEDWAEIKKALSKRKSEREFDNLAYKLGC